jgi:hypothetical protein
MRNDVERREAEEWQREVEALLFTIIQLDGSDQPFPLIPVQWPADFRCEPTPLPSSTFWYGCCKNSRLLYPHYRIVCPTGLQMSESPNWRRSLGAAMRYENNLKMLVAPSFSRTERLIASVDKSIYRGPRKSQVLTR